MDHFELFVKEKPYELLSLLYSLETTYPSFLARAINCSFFHTVDLLRKFERAGLVEVQKNSLRITEKGKRIFEALRSVREVEEENTSMRFIRRTLQRIQFEESEEVRQRLRGYIRREMMKLDGDLRRWVERELLRESQDRSREPQTTTSEPCQRDPC